MVRHFGSTLACASTFSPQCLGRLRRSSLGVTEEHIPSPPALSPAQSGPSSEELTICGKRLGSGHSHSARPSATSPPSPRSALSHGCKDATPLACCTTTDSLRRCGAIWRRLPRSHVVVAAFRPLSVGTFLIVESFPPSFLHQHPTAASATSGQSPQIVTPVRNSGCPRCRLHRPPPRPLLFGTPPPCAYSKRTCSHCPIRCVQPVPTVRKRSLSFGRRGARCLLTTSTTRQISPLSLSLSSNLASASTGASQQFGRQAATTATPESVCRSLSNRMHCDQRSTVAATVPRRNLVPTGGHQPPVVWLWT